MLFGSPFIGNDDDEATQLPQQVRPSCPVSTVCFSEPARSTSITGVADGASQMLSFRQALEVHMARLRCDLTQGLEGLAAAMSVEHERRNPQIDCLATKVEEDPIQDFSAGMGATRSSTTSSYWAGATASMVSNNSRLARVGSMTSELSVPAKSYSMGHTSSGSRLFPRGIPVKLTNDNSAARHAQGLVAKRGWNGFGPSRVAGASSNHTAPEQPSGGKFAKDSTPNGKTGSGETSATSTMRESRSSDVDQAEVLPCWVQAEEKLTKSISKYFSSSRGASMSSIEDGPDDTEDTGDLPMPLRFLQNRVLHPSSARRLVWDVIGIFFIAYDIAFIPLQFFDPFENKEMRIFRWVARMFWTIDLGAGFMTGYLLKDGDVETRLGPIARRYIRTWLPIDVLVVLFDWVDIILEGRGMGELVSARMGKTMRVMRVLRSVRLVKIAKLPILAGTWLETYIRSEKVMLVASMSKLMLFIVTLMHFIACIWYGIGEGYGEDAGWVRVFDGTAAPEDLLYRYMTSFHWSLTQFAGTMEIGPGNSGERIFAVLVLLAAFVVSATFVSNITSSMTRLNMISGNEASMFAALRDYLIDRRMPRKLMVRVLRNAHHAMRESRHNCPEKDILLLHLISEPLRMEIHFELHSPILRSHPLFKRMQQDLPALSRKLCHFAVCTAFLSAEDVLFVEGEVKDPPEMYFVTKGVVGYKEADCSSVYASEGAWVSEPVLWCDWVHRGVLKARSECELLVLDAQSFRTISQQNGSPNFNLGKYAREFVKLLNQGMLTDVDKNFAAEAMHTVFDSEQEGLSVSSGTAVKVRFWKPNAWPLARKSKFGRNSTEGAISPVPMGLPMPGFKSPPVTD